MKGPEETLEILKHIFADDSFILEEFARRAASRFGSNGDPLVIDFAIRCQREVVRLRLPGHSERSAALNNLGSALQMRHSVSRKHADLEETISLYREALLLRPLGHPERSLSLTNLAHSLEERYRTWNEPVGLEEVVSLHREALSLRPSGHPHRPQSLVNLANSLRGRSTSTGDLDELEEAISLHRETLICSLTSPYRYLYLNDLAKSLFARYKLFREYSNLKEAISLYREALQLHPPGDPRRASSLTGLSISLQENGKEWGEVVSLLRELLLSYPKGHAGRSSVLYNVANSLYTLYQSSGLSTELEESISLQQEALMLRPPGHPDRPSSLNNLATSLQSLHESSGDPSKLEEAVSLRRESLRITSSDHPYRSLYLTSLANSLSSWYDLSGERSDLEESISLHREALRLHSPGHPDRSDYLGGLAYSLHKRYKFSGDRTDLDEAISLRREALESCPLGHAQRYLHLNNLATSLNKRHDLSGELLDLEEAISLSRKALLLCTPPHPRRFSCLLTLSTSLITRYGATAGKDRADLDESITLQREVLELHPSGDPRRVSSLGNLANSLMARYQTLGDLADLEVLITLQREVLQLHPPGHNERPLCQNNLANSLRTRYEIFSENVDLEEAVSLHREAVPLRPPGHRDRSICLYNLSLSLQELHKSSPSPSLDAEIQQLVLEAIHDNFSPLSQRFRFGMLLARSGKFDGETRLRLYTELIALLHQLVATNPSLDAQLQRLINSPFVSGLAVEGAATLIGAGDLQRAVSILDYGRQVLLSSLQHYRTPVDDLRVIDPILADRFISINSRLEQLSSAASQQMSSPGIHRDEFLKQQQVLADERNGVLKEIRLLNGFEDFLLRTPYSKLQSAAEEGPIVVVTVCPSRCDALVVTRTGDPVHVPLTDASLSELGQLFVNLIDVNEINHQHGLLNLLRVLWRTVVSPVASKLLSMGFTRGQRIWWCPVSIFSALPLHAAGPYMEGERNLPDLFISSYTPTLSSLIKARIRPSEETRPPTLLLIGHPGVPELKSVGSELEVIKRIDGITTSTLFGHKAVRDLTLDAMKEHVWIHLSCHGKVNHKQPFDSYFQLDRSQPLTVKDIISANLPNAELAFLSACHSASGSLSEPNECLSLASALQFAGFRSVIGTMWEMFDNEGPRLAKDFYTELMRRGGTYKESATALHHSIKRMRKKNVPIERWVMFIHIGA